MDQNFLRPDLLPSSLPLSALVALALLGMGGWIVAHRLAVRRFRSPRARLAVLVPIGTVGCWTLIQLAGRFLFLGCRWHLMFASLVSGLSIELVSWLYVREASRIQPRRRRRIVVGCRMAAVATVLFALLQPGLVWESERTIRRRVVVLLDDSASMHFPDRYWTDEERLDMARALGLLQEPEESLAGLPEELDGLRGRFAQQAAAAAAGPGGLSPEDLSELAGDARAVLEKAAASMDALARRLSAKDHPAVAESLPRHADFIRRTLLPALAPLAEPAESGRAPDRATAEAVTRALAQLDQLALAVPAEAAAGSLVVYDEMDEEGRTAILRACDTTREYLARRLLAGRNGADASPLEILGRTYDLDLYRFGSASEADPNLSAPPARAEETTGREDAKTVSFRSSTDFTAALETALHEIPPEEIAGFLIVTDGRHTGEAGVDAVSRQIGASGAPINVVVVGGTRPPVDVALTEARAPESVFAGDKLRVSGAFTATGAKGNTLRVRLFLVDPKTGAEELLDESDPIYVQTDDFMRDFRFTDPSPKRMQEDPAAKDGLPKGVRRYRVEVVAHDPQHPDSDERFIPNEEFTNNNDWTLDVSVTDDRTNVLLVDDFPRWEFRYLRNLFYGRDKSVHLQEYLIHPDRVAGHEDAVLPPASASREFGDTQSGSFPGSAARSAAARRAEWRKFDVIILGDLDDSVLTDEVVEEIKYCVEQRGALLVLIAGPRAMPHRIRNATLRDMMPVLFEESDLPCDTPPEGAFHLRLAPAGRGHMAMRQSSSSFENEQIWNDLPPLYWRHAVLGVKPGAEVLAYAEPEGTLGAESVARLAVQDMQADPDAAVRRLSEMREAQAANSLVVARAYGHGKVLQLNTDRTWRLRYRVGDTRHHQFWGQVLRWGAGDKLRAGNTFVRIGTDQLRYTPTDRVTVQARFQDLDFNSMDDLDPEVRIYDASGERLLRTAELKFREDSNGFYEGELEPFADPGAYVVRVSCEEAARALGGEFPRGLQTRFVVVTSKRPAEFVNVSASFDVANRLARATGGVAVPPSRFAEALSNYGEGSRVMHDRAEITLWDNAALLALLFVLLTVEWILRKRAGLS